jgi:hypothetical protein
MPENLFTLAQGQRSNVAPTHTPHTRSTSNATNHGAARRNRSALKLGRPSSSRQTICPSSTAESVRAEAAISAQS